MTQAVSANIVQSGMMTPLGADTKMSLAGMAAGISRYQTTHYLNGRFDGIKMALVPNDALEPLTANYMGITTRQARMLRLASQSMREAIDGQPITEPLPLFLAGPETTPGRPPALTPAFISQLSAQSQTPLDEANSQVFPLGRAGIFFALSQAMDFLQNSKSPFVLIGGVDTCWDPITLSLLARENRLQTEEGVMDGYVPAEASGFLLLSRQPGNGVKIFKPGLAAEPGHRYSEAPYQGEGLSQAFNQALAFADGAAPSQVLSSLNGESFGNKEYGVAMLRHQQLFTAPISHIHPADCLGDTGAAFGAIALSMAAASGAATTLCYGSSDGQHRGAVVVSTSTN